MATPSNITTKALNGRFTLNKSLSDDPDECLRLQGVAWWKRRAISLFSLTLRIKHTTNDTGVEHIHMAQIISGIPGMTEDRILDGQDREYDHLVFGLVTSTSCRMAIEDITDEFLKRDWAQDCVDDGLVLTDSRSTPGKNAHTWRNAQMWGFIIVNGERKFVTKVTFTSPEKQDPIHVRFVYDYVGAA